MTDPKPVRVLMAQARQPFANRNGREGTQPETRKRPVEDMGVAEMRQELVETRNTIVQLRKNPEPFKRQRRDGWQRNNCWQDQQGTDQKGSCKSVIVPEGNRKSVKAPSSRPKKVHANMLQTCRETLIRMRSRIVRECFLCGPGSTHLASRSNRKVQKVMSQRHLLPRLSQLRRRLSTMSVLRP